MNRHTQTRTDATTMTPEALHEVYRLCGLDRASWDQVYSLKIRAGVVRVKRFRKPEIGVALFVHGRHGRRVAYDTVEIKIESAESVIGPCVECSSSEGIHQDFCSLSPKRACPGCGSVVAGSHTASCQLGKIR